MGKKQFDHIENRIREAAENSEPVFDEYAWAKMEARLDKEDNKKRRFFVWWIVLPLLFIAAGSVYFFFNNKPSEKTITPGKDQYIADNKSTRQKNIPSVTPSSNSNQYIADSNSSKQKDIASVPSSPIGDQHITDIKSLQQKNIPSATASIINHARNTNKKIDFNKKKAPEVSQVIKQSFHNSNDVTTAFVNGISKKIKGAKKGKLLSKTNKGEIDNTDATEPGVDKADNILDLTSVNKIAANKKTDILTDTIIKKDSSKNNIVNNLPDKKIADKNKKLTTSRFYFLGSIGEDAGSVKLLSFRNNKIIAKYGVGVGYQINKKLSLQTGFYASRKKYIAGPGDYNPKQGSYLDTMQIIKVDASCLVYDIPLTLRYNVLQKAKTIYYVTAGISSFIMKKEDYYYHYFRNYIYDQSSWTYTGNKNLFAVLNFSAGIEKKLSPYVSIQAEPSVSIPLSGVGEGRVKLYSTALQLSIKYQPPKKHK